MTGAELMIRCLEREGVEYVFGVPGEETLDLNEALFRKHSSRGHATQRLGIPGGFNLQRLHDLCRPAPSIHRRVPLLDRAVPGDHHADALRALVGIGVGAVGRPDLPIDVADEREVEAVLVGECLVLGGGIKGDAEDDGSLLVVVRLEVAEPATLRRSPRGVGLRKKPQDDGLPREVRQPHGLAVVIAAHEVGRLVSWSEHVAFGVRGGDTSRARPWFVDTLIMLHDPSRRECLDHVMMLNEAHRRRLLRAYFAYSNTVRPHQALAHNCPRPRPVQPPARGRVVAIPQVGGLPHHSQRAA